MSKLPDTFSRYNPPPSEPQPTGGESMTHIECQKECDINYIVDRYTKTGSWGVGDNRLPLDGLTGFDGDFKELMDRLILAQDTFQDLPSKVRDRFANDPARLLAFLSEEGNREEAVKLGLIVSPSTDPPPSTPVSVVDDKTGKTE